MANCNDNSMVSELDNATAVPVCAPTVHYVSTLSRRLSIIPSGPSEIPRSPSIRLRLQSEESK